MLDGAERQARAVIAAWQDGVYEGEAMLDDDGHGVEDIHIRARVTKQGSDLTVDLTDCHPQVTGFVNSSHANMQSAVVVALAYLIDPRDPEERRRVPPGEGESQAGTVGVAAAGAPVTLCTNHCGQEIIEAIIKALAPACPERAMAGWGRRFRIAMQGKDPRTGKPFIWHLFQARPGGGASSAGDGWPGAGEWQAAGGIKFGSIEVPEVRFPLLFRRHEFRPDSGGDGRYRGGPGGELELVIETAEPAVGNTAGDGVRRRLRAPRRQGRHAAPLRAAVGRPPGRALKTKEVGVVLGPATSFMRSRAAAAAGAIRRGARRRSAPATWTLASSRPRGTEACIGSASMSAARSPTWSRSTRRAASRWRRRRRRRRTRRSA